MTQNHIRLHPWLIAVLGADGFLVSDVSTLGVLCYVARGLWHNAQFPPATWVAVLLLWVLASVAAAACAGLAGRLQGLATFKCTMFLLRAVLCSLALKASASSLTSRQMGAFALMLVAAVLANRALLGLIERVRAPDRWEGLRFGVAQGAALFAVHPYVRNALLGAGDATSYSLMIADFLKQWRSGIFPVLIGQSQYAFSGGFQPLRNAPYLQHLAWVFDLAGLGTFNVFALQNLTVLASMLGAVLGCYVALRVSNPRGQWMALALAALYGLCPGVLAPLYGGDMYPTFMVLPFIPWLVLGIEQSSTLPDRTWPWVLQGAALAAMWLAHPPVAAWATLVSCMAGLWTLGQSRNWRVIGRMMLALGIFLALGGYLFVSVSSLRLPAFPRAAALASVDYKIATLRGDWVSSLLPVSREGNHLLGDVQLGYGLWACMLAAIAGAVRSRPGRSLSRCFAAILLFAWPIPILTRIAWRSLPSELLLVTNQWPMDRFYALLAGLAVFIVAPVFGRYSRKGLWPRILVGGLLMAACLWSTAETLKFFRRAAAIGRSESASEDLHRSENILLSRTHSYEYLGTPSYFSYGHMDPRLETRLLDLDTRRVFADGATYRLDVKRPSSTLALPRGEEGGLPGTVHLGPGDARILRFDFLGQALDGELQLSGGALSNVYSLPQSGYPRSFGSGPEAGHTLILENSTAAAEDISLRFVSRDGANAKGVLARVSIEPVSEADRAIRLTSLTPFQALVTAERACYLETPKLYVPGYEAFVDGVATPLARSPDGLVAVPLGKGEHSVRIPYVGSRLLRLSFYASASAWLVLLGAVGAFAFKSERTIVRWAGMVPRIGVALTRGLTWKPIHARAFVGMAVLAAATGLWFRSGLFPRGRFGGAQLEFRLPWPAFGASEPLLTTGRPGAGDFYYITYLDGRHVSIGHDKWGYGGAQSRPITVDYDGIQHVEVGFDPDALAGPSKEHRDAAKGPRLFVKWNGVTVLSEDASAYPSRDGDATFGENTIGGSTVRGHFSGEILKVVRVRPGQAPLGGD